MKFADLSFVNVTDDGEMQHEDAWAPEQSGDFATDCAVGRRCFAELLDLMRADQNPLYLSRVLAAQVRRGKWEAVEIGFSQAMAEHLL